LLGDSNFSGRLPVSWERAAADNPSYANYYYNDPAHPDRITYREGIFVGYRGYQQANTKPLFPFGFGLSYTTFQYTNLQVVRSASGTQPSWTVSFDVTNSGKRAGTDVAQIYVSAGKSKVPRPPRELKGFTRVQLAPGETKHQTLSLDARAFAYYDAAAKGWRVEAGRYTVELGRSVENIDSRVTVDLASPSLMRVAH